MCPIVMMAEGRRAVIEPLQCPLSSNRSVHRLGNVDRL